MSEHLTSDQIAAYLERGMPEPERATVEAHLARCRPCRDELAEASGLLRAGRGPAAWRIALPVAAAAALVGIFSLGVLPFGGSEEGRDPFRDSGAERRRESVATIPVVEPADDASLGAAALTFRWRGSGEETVYAFMLADEEGSPIWSATTTDTVVSLPDEVAAGLVGGDTYFWTVDAAFVDGRSAGSEARAFTYAGPGPGP